MIDYLVRFATDERSIAIAILCFVCWLITREKPSAHAVGGLFVFVAAFSLFVMWKYAPEFEKVEMLGLETATAEQLRTYIASRNEATDVLWRQMEMYVFGVHFTALLYLTWVFFLERELFARIIVSILWAWEAHSVATGNFWCRFVLETKGSWLVDHLMTEGWTPGSCSVHWGETNDWLPAALAVLPLLYAYVIYKRARARLSS